MVITDTTTGLPMVCDTCGALADFVWYGGLDGKPKRCCPAHNPMYSTGALPVNFTGHTVCPTCGK
ncbi:MAG TPA: hypothetical protein VKS82_27290 [Streptosporangiaceae bacterium]|nr:hypothetical protein [Streptosporangiaceae bacterium]